MRRRSSLEASFANGRSSTSMRWRCLLYGVIMGVLFLALTLCGNRPSPSKPSVSVDGAAMVGGRDGVHGSKEGRDDVQDQGAISPLIWRGIYDGIASTPASAEDIHLVFSTDCSPYQNYQAILLFHSAEVSDAMAMLRCNLCCRQALWCKACLTGWGVLC